MVGTICTGRVVPGPLGMGRNVGAPPGAYRKYFGEKHAMFTVHLHWKEHRAS